MEMVGIPVALFYSMPSISLRVIFLESEQHMLYYDSFFLFDNSSLIVHLFHAQYCVRLPKDHVTISKR